MSNNDFDIRVKYCSKLNSVLVYSVGIPAHYNTKDFQVFFFEDEKQRLKNLVYEFGLLAKYGTKFCDGAEFDCLASMRKNFEYRNVKLVETEDYWRIYIADDFGRYPDNDNCSLLYKLQKEVDKV